jgi:CheY-like chemotaxis protein
MTDTSERLVLVVEDSRATLLLLTRMLEVYPGLKCFAAPDAPTAIQLAREHRFDLILLDILLPIMDGNAIARAMRHMPTNTETPIVAITSFAAEAEWKEKALAAGANECLNKSVFYGDPVANVRALLRKYLPDVVPEANE